MSRAHIGRFFVCTQLLCAAALFAGASCNGSEPAPPPAQTVGPKPDGKPATPADAPNPTAAAAGRDDTTVHRLPPHPDEGSTGNATQQDATGGRPLKHTDTLKDTDIARPATKKNQTSVVAQLLAAVRDPKIGDEGAHNKLREAKKLGATVRERAKAANARGESLFATPPRAAGFFEWARATDKRFPDATFNLAKLAANSGDINQVKTLLTEVADRGGKRLLRTIEFDPTFALVANDSEVQELK
ncbi:MAG: hypothetical protein V3V08_20455 [Nannocystaceae bacterium]